MSKTILCYGEVLWDLLPSGAALGGAPLNFAYRLQELGNEAYLVSCLGSDDLGTRAAQQMRNLGLPLDFVQSTSEKPTGTVPITLSTDGQPHYIITPDVAYDRIEPSQALVEAAGSADCIYFGTLAQRNDTSRHTLHALLDALPKTVLRVCDINLRQDCHDRATILASLRHADIMKLNLDEVAPVADAVSGMETASPADFAQRLIERFDLTACVITRGSGGVYAANHNGEHVDLDGIPVEVVDTVGAGDAFFAGFTDAVLRGESLAAACRRANALGALAARKSGGTARITADEMRELQRVLT